MSPLIPLLCALAPCQSPAPRVVEPNDASGAPSISDDGRFVVFESLASNFAEGDSKGSWDVFLYERATGKVTQISDDDRLPARSPAISGDGAWIAFQHGVPARVTITANGARSEQGHPWKLGILRREDGVVRWLGETSPTLDWMEPPSRFSMSRDGSRLAFQSVEDTFSVVRLFDRRTDATTTVRWRDSDRAPTGDSIEPSLSPNGRFLVASCTERLVDLLDTHHRFDDEHHVVLKDLETDSTGLVCHCDDEAWTWDLRLPRVSDDGRTVGYSDDRRRPGTGYLRALEASWTGAPDPDPLPGMLRYWNRSAITWMSADANVVLLQGLPAGSPSDGRERPLQIFLEQDAGERILISRAPDDAPGNGSSTEAVASQDLRTMVFASDASNLVDGDGNRTSDVFLLERTSGTLTRIMPNDAIDASKESDGSRETHDDSIGPRLSDDGELLVFASRASNFFDEDRSNSWDLFLHRDSTGIVVPLTDGQSPIVSLPGISGDGRRIAYLQYERNAKELRGAGGWRLKLHTVDEGASETVFAVWGSQTPFPPPAPSMSRDGRRIAVEVDGSIHLVDLDTCRTDRISGDGAALSADGRFLTYIPHSDAGANGKEWSVFVRDIELRSTQCVPDRARLHDEGACARPWISTNGKWIVFSRKLDWRAGLTTSGVVFERENDYILRIPAAARPRRLSQGTFAISWLSPDGRTVLVSSRGHGFLRQPLAAEQVFFHELGSSDWKPVSRNAGGADADRPASEAVASADGSRIAFTSAATNLVPGDTNDASDIFVVERKSGAIRRVVPAAR